MESRKVPPRKDGRVIIHFDYDCFYAAVCEAANPALRSQPLAVQQKQIIVTCNYEARRRGLFKLQLIREARRMCPELVVELGEDISRFRDASKALYAFLRAFAWGSRVERLGFDEVWLDVSDLVAWNVDCLNRNDLSHAWFQLARDDPTVGFAFDAGTVAGHVYPPEYAPSQPAEPVDDLTLRLRLGSHLAMHMRHRLEEQHGYTSTVGIATNKLLAKLVGNLNKPKGQTTLMPPLEGPSSNAIAFLDDHEIGKIPGIGFKLALKLREFVLGRPALFDFGLVYGGTREHVTVAALREHPDVSPEMLEKLLAGPGSPHGIGYKIWCLLHGVDDSDVSQARDVPRQISIEDSYIRLDTMDEVTKELEALARSLLTRMRIDLLGSDDDWADESKDGDDTNTNPPAPAAGLAGKRWLAHPRTLRLTTRPRQPLQPDGTRVRTFKRISHSAPLPVWVFQLRDGGGVDALAARLVHDALLPMFRRLHPQRAGWNLSLVNLAVTNMAEAAGQSRTASGRDIGNMFRRQDDVLRDFRVTDVGDGQGVVSVGEDDTGVVEQYDAEAAERVGADAVDNDAIDSDDADHNADTAASWKQEDDGSTGLGDESMADGDESDSGWIDEDGADAADDFCESCGSHIPVFARLAHRRFHSPEVAQEEA